MADPATYRVGLMIGVMLMVSAVGLEAQVRYTDHRRVEPAEFVARYDTTGDAGLLARLLSVRPETDPWTSEALDLVADPALKTEGRRSAVASFANAMARCQDPRIRSWLARAMGETADPVELGTLASLLVRFVGYPEGIEVLWPVLQRRGLTGPASRPTLTRLGSAIGRTRTVDRAAYFDRLFEAGVEIKGELYFSVIGSAVLASDGGWAVRRLLETIDENPGDDRVVVFLDAVDSWLAMTGDLDPKRHLSPADVREVRRLAASIESKATPGSAIASRAAGLGARALARVGGGLDGQRSEPVAGS